MKRAAAGLAVGALLLLSCSAPAASQSLEGLLAEEEEISVDAAEVSYDQTTDTVVARGRVVVRRGALQLEAEEIRISRSSNEADARGAVVLTTPGGTYQAEEVYLDLDQETGLLKDASVQSTAQPFTLLGESIEKYPGQCYRITNGAFTTCRCEKGPQSWTLLGDSLELEVGGYGTVEGLQFNVLDTPVLYLPWAKFPITTQRQSGLLGPRFAASDRRGFQILQPFFWAINKSHDLTTALDIETAARVGLLNEYRYALSRSVDGGVGFTFFNESFRGNPDGLSLRDRIPENRWSASVDHSHRDILGGELYADGFLVGDDGFLREINALATSYTRDVAIRTLQFTESRVGYWFAARRVGVKVEGTFYQDIDLTGIVATTPTPDGSSGDPVPTPGPDELRRESETLHRAPSVEVRGQQKMGGPLLATLSASAVDYQRGRGVDGARLDIEPGLQLSLPMGPYAFGSVRASIRETAYALTERETTTGDRLPSNPTRESFTAGMQLGTSLARNYAVEVGNLRALQHSIEPRLEYLYAPAVDEDDLPLFDAFDRISARNLVTYGVHTRLLGKEVAQDEKAMTRVRELGALWLYQSVDLERRIPSVAAEAEEDDHFSDIDIGGAVNPDDNLSLRFATQFDFGATQLTAAKLGFLVKNPWEETGDATSANDLRSSAGMTYRFLTGNELQEISGNFTLRLARWLGLGFSTRYDVDDGFLDRYVGLRLRSQCDCWSLDVGLTDRTNPDEVEANVQFSLVGFDSGGDLGFGLAGE